MRKKKEEKKEQNKHQSKTFKDRGRTFRAAT